MSSSKAASFLFLVLIAAYSCSGGATPSEPETVVHSSTASSADEAASWQRFHGHQGYNVSADAGLLKSWPEGGPTLVWTAGGIGGGYSSVSVGGGRIFTAGAEGGETVVTALDLDGSILWQAVNGPAWDESYPGSRGTPTVDGDRVYHQSPSGELSCFKAADGTRIWGTNVLQRFGAENIRWGLSESLLVDGDVVITCPGGSRVSVAALDKMTGETVWTARGLGARAGYASPTVAEVAGLRMIVTMNADAVIAVSAADGELLWRLEHETSYDVNATMPVHHQGRVFISSGYGSGSMMLGITVEGESAAVEKVWESSDLDNQHGGVVLYDGHLYGAAHKRNRGKWVCLDWKTGALEYAEKGVGMGSATAAEGKLYTLSEKGEVGLVEATPEGHTVISSFELPKGGKGATWAHPVVCGGRLYLRHGDRLFAYDVRE